MDSATLLATLHLDGYVYISPAYLRGLWRWWEGVPGGGGVSGEKGNPPSHVKMDGLNGARFRPSARWKTARHGTTASTGVRICPMSGTGGSGEASLFPSVMLWYPRAGADRGSMATPATPRRCVLQRGSGSRAKPSKPTVHSPRSLISASQEWAGPLSSHVDPDR